MKQGGDLCKEIATILQERSDLEAAYAKGLSKLATKAARASRDSIGTVAIGIQSMAAELEADGESHKVLAVALADEVAKPLKVLMETQHKCRKSVEATVDKCSKTVGDLRASECKAKKTCCACAKDNERAQEQLLDARIGRSKILSDKDVAKLEAKRRKAEGSAKKSDLEYYAICVAAERSRLEWETAVLKGCDRFQGMEEDRVAVLRDTLKKYSEHLAQVPPKRAQGCNRLSETAARINVASDVHTVISQKGTSGCVSEQILPDFYAEDMGNIMNKERRREALDRFLMVLKHDIERERRGKQGVENLARVFQETPTFGDRDAQDDVQEKLQHMRAMLAYLEASKHKLQCCLADLDGGTKPSHPLGKHIEYHKDKQGQLHSVLKVPSWVRLEPESGEQTWDKMDGTLLDRGSADGTSHSPDHYEDDFSVDSEESGSSRPPLRKQISVCKAIYDYRATMMDELTIRPGDVITVYDKQDCGWWHGELNGATGIFPATYVEEIR